MVTYRGGENQGGVFARSPWAALLAVAIALVVLYGASRSVGRAFALWRETRDLRATVAQLERKNAELEKELESLDAPAVIEREAKANLNLKKLGEEVVVVVPDAPSAENGGLEKGWWEVFKSFIKSFISRE